MSDRTHAPIRTLVPDCVPPTHASGPVQDAGNAAHQEDLGIRSKADADPSVAMSEAFTEALQGSLEPEALAAKGLNAEEIAALQALPGQFQGLAETGDVVAYADPSTLPPHLAKAGQAGDWQGGFDPQCGKMYLPNGEMTPDLVNTIAHETSHAANSQSPEALRRQELHGQLFDESGHPREGTSDKAMMEYQLLTWKEERHGEFIGGLAGDLSRDDGRPMFMDRRREATSLGGSSAAARKQFDAAKIRAVEAGADWSPEKSAAVDDFVRGAGESPL